VVQKSVTLNDLNGRVVCVISPNSLAFGSGTCYVNVEDTHRYIMHVKCSPNNIVFSDISLVAILAGNRPQRSGR